MKHIVAAIGAIAKFLSNIDKLLMSAYGRLMKLLGFVVASTSDEGADIAARGLPFLAPLPNALSLYARSQVVLNFTSWQALAFAGAIECAIFAVFEINLYMFDGYMSNKTRFRVPLIVSSIVSTLTLFLVVWFVYSIEVIPHQIETIGPAGEAIVQTLAGHPILALLPFLSASGSVSLALKRWKYRHDEAAAAINDNEAAKLAAKLLASEAQAAQTAADLAKATSALGDMTAEIAERDRAAAATAQALADLKSALLTLQAEQARSQNEAKILGKKVTDLEKEKAVLESEKSYLSASAFRGSDGNFGQNLGENYAKNQSNFGQNFGQNLGEKNTKLGKADRRKAILIALSQSSQETFSTTDLAVKHGVTDQTIRNDKDWLVDNGHFLNSDQWVITDLGMALLAG